MSCRLTKNQSWPLSQCIAHCSSIVTLTMLVIIFLWNHLSLLKGRFQRAGTNPLRNTRRLYRLPFTLFNLLLTKSSFKLQVTRQLHQRKDETMPLPVISLQWLKGLPRTNCVFENTPADRMALLSGPKMNFLINWCIYH